MNTKERIPVETADGAIGYKVDVTNEDWYRDPKITLYDDLDHSAFELICDYAEVIGVFLDRDEPDYWMIRQVGEKIMEILEEEFDAKFPFAKCG